MAALAGCLEPGATTCESGQLCPVGKVCHAASDRCVLQDAIDACAGIADSAPCAIAGTTGVCLGGVCDAAFCGDGLRSATEACEGADLADLTCAAFGFYEEGDGLDCTATCTIVTDGCAFYCGDGEVSHDESCEPAGALVGYCVDLDFAAGRVLCSDRCDVSTGGCAQFSWNEVSTNGGSVEDLWSDGEIAYALSGNQVRYYDGFSWLPLPLQPDATGDTLARLWAAAPDDLWIGGAEGVLHHWDGAGWTTAAGGGASIRDLWGFAGDDVFAVTTAGDILHHDGRAWSPMAHPSPSTPLRAVHGAAPDDVWAIGDQGLILHYDGSSWTSVPSPGPQQLGGVWAAGPDDAWIVGERFLRWDGATWQVQPFDPGLIDHVMGTGPSEVFAASYERLFRFDGLAWHDVRVRTGFADDGHGALWADRSGTAIVGGTQGDSFFWRDFVIPPLPGDDTAPATLAAWGVDSANYVVLVQDDPSYLAYHVVDGQLTQRVLPGFPGGLFGLAGSLIYLTVGDDLLRFNGSSWSNLQSFVGESLRQVWAASPTDVYVAAADGDLYRYDGGSWGPVDFGDAAATGIAALHGSGPDDVWLVTDDRELRHFDGTWHAVELAQPESYLNAVWSLAPDDVWVLSPDFAQHYDGAVWTVHELPGGGYRHLAATAPDDVFAIADGGVAHWDGIGWSPVELGLPLTFSTVLTGAWASPSLVVFTSDLPGPHRLIRRRPWNCRAAETGCADGIDDDCDGATDAEDGDC